MKKTQFFLILTVIVMSLTGCQKDEPIGSSYMEVGLIDFIDPSIYNLFRAKALIDSIFPFIALTEGDHGDGAPYYSGVRWTASYGVTMKADGTPIERDDYVPRDSAEAWAKLHVRRRIVPFFKFFDLRQLNDAQIIGTALFIYNVGGETCTGKRLDGKELCRPSMFFLAVNAGAPDEECVNYLTHFKKSGGQVATGLLKRRWVEGAAFQGILTSESIASLKPLGFYETKNMGDYYFVNKRNKPIEVNGVYQLRYDKKAISTFFEKNEATITETSVSDII